MDKIEKLPLKWATKINNKEELEIANRFLRNKFYFPGANDNWCTYLNHYIHFPPDKLGSHGQDTGERWRGYTEISFNDFKRLVLMEKETIPEYYECIKEINSSFILGKIYKIINKNNLEAGCNFIDEKGKENGMSGTNYLYFKPSTKEAFDLQNKPKEPELVIGGYISGIDPCGNKLCFIKYNKQYGDRFIYDHILMPNNSSYTSLKNYEYTFKDVKPLKPDEIEWMEKVITANKFIPKEEALKTTEFKIGDWVKVMSYRQCNEGNGIRTDNLIAQLIDLKEKNELRSSGIIDINADFIVKESNQYYNIRKEHIISFATPEEIAKVAGKEEEFSPGDKIVGKSMGGNIIQDSMNPLGVVGKYFVPDRVVYKGTEVELWSNGSQWSCKLEDISHYKEEQPMNTYGLKVGDYIPVRFVKAWGKLGNFYKQEGWKASEDFTTDSKIEKFFCNKDGVVIFSRQNSSDFVGFKAEGFKEFMDNFNKPKNVTPLSKFEIGNKVKCTGKGEVSCKAYRLGCRAIDYHLTVVEQNQAITDKKFNKEEWWYRFDNGNWYTEDSLELLEPMKTELKSLPEKWCIAVTPENEEALQYYNKKCNSTCYGSTSSSCNKGYMSSHNVLDESILKDGKAGASFHYYNPTGHEITLDQFKKWVLKSEDKPKSESLVGRYLKALRDGANSIGKIKKGQYTKILENDYDIDFDNKSGYCYSKESIGTDWELMPEGFTPPIIVSTGSNSTNIGAYVKKESILDINLLIPKTDNSLDISVRTIHPLKTELVKQNKTILF